MTIGEVSIKTGISKDTLRYYEKIGLIGEVRKEGGKRNYTKDNLETISFIICMKNAGFSLENIIKFLNLYEKGNKTLDERIQMLLNQKELLQKEIEEKNKTMEFLNYKINLYNKKKEGIK